MIQTNDVAAPSEGGLGAWLRQIFSIDPRSLAAMRIGMGLILIWEALRNATVFRQYFLEDGLTPSFLFNAGIQRWQSVYFISGSPAWTYAMFGLQVLLALMLIIGYRTRLATIGCFVMSWSLVNRNNLLATGGHNLLCWIFIWSIFLPLGAAASVDAKTARVQRQDILSTATVGILLQMIFLYAVAVVAKLNPGWYSDLTAVHGFLRSHIGNPLGRAITLLPELTAVLCVATLLLESLGPTLALISGKHWMRTVIVLLFVGFHLGLVACLNIAAFGWICIAAWMVYMPGSFWDWLDRFNAWRWMTDRWRQLTKHIAGLVSTPKWLAVRSMRLRLGLIPSTFVGLLVVMVTILNLTTMIPQLRPFFPGSNRKLKQVWTVMDVPWQYRMRLVVEADTKDGSTVKLVEPSPFTLSPRWFDYIWSPERGPDIETQVRLVRHAMMQEPGDRGFTTYLTRLREQWNATHNQTIIRMRAIVLASTFPPPAARSLQDRVTAQPVIYEWNDTGDGIGEFKYHHPD